MAQINSFSLLNVHFNNKSGQTNHLGNFMISPRAKDAMLFAANQTGKTSILIMLSSLFLGLNHNKFQGGRRLDYYFKNNHEIPAAIIIDFVDATDSSYHTIVAQWFNHTANNDSEHLDDCLDRYGLVLTYNAAKTETGYINPPLQNNDFSLLEELNLIKKDRTSNAYLPCKSRDIATNVKANILHLAGGNEADIHFVGKLNSSSLSKYFNAVKVCTNIDHRAWESTTAKVLQTEGGISGLFMDSTKKTAISSRKLLDQFFVEILKHTNKQTDYNNLLQNVSDLINFYVNNAEDIKKIDQIKTIKKRLQDIDQLYYTTQMNNLRKNILDRNSLIAYLLKLKDQYQHDQTNDKLTQTQLRQDVLQAKYAIKQFQQQETTNKFNELKNALSQANQKLTKLQETIYDKYRIAYTNSNSQNQTRKKRLIDRNTVLQNQISNQKVNYESAQQENMWGKLLFDYYHDANKDYTKQINDLQNQKESLNDQIKQNDAKQAEIQNTLQKLDEKAGEYSAQIRNYEHTHLVVDADFNAQKTQFERDLSNSKNQLQQIKISDKKYEQQNIEFENSIETYRNQLNKLIQQKSQLETDYRRLTDNYNTIQQIKKAIQEFHSLDLDQIQIKRSNVSELRDLVTQIINKLMNQELNITIERKQLKQQIDLLSNDQLFTIPDTLAHFLRQYNIAYTSGLAYLKKLDFAKQKQIIQKIHLLPYACLVSENDLALIKQNFKEPLNQPVLFISKDNLNHQFMLNDSDYYFAYNFDMSILSNLKQYISDLTKHDQDLSSQLNKLKNDQTKFNQYFSFLKRDDNFVSLNDLDTNERNQKDVQQNIDKCQQHIAAIKQQISTNNSVHQQNMLNRIKLSNQINDLNAKIVQVENDIALQKEWYANQSQLKQVKKQRSESNKCFDKIKQTSNDLKNSLSRMEQDIITRTNLLSHCRDNELKYQSYQNVISNNLVAIQSQDEANDVARQLADSQSKQQKDIKDLQDEIERNNELIKNYDDKLNAKNQQAKTQLLTIDVKSDISISKLDNVQNYDNHFNLDTFIHDFESDDIQQIFKKLQKQVNNQEFELRNAQSELNQIKKEIDKFVSQNHIDLTENMVSFVDIDHARQALKQSNDKLVQIEQELKTLEIALAVLNTFNNYSIDFDYSKYFNHSLKLGYSISLQSSNKLQQLINSIQSQSDNIDKQQASLTKSMQKSLSIFTESNNINIQQMGNELLNTVHADFSMLARDCLSDSVEYKFNRIIKTDIEVWDAKLEYLNETNQTYDQLLNDCSRLVTVLAQTLHRGLLNIQNASNVHLDSMQTGQKRCLIKFGMQVKVSDDLQKHNEDLTKQFRKVCSDILTMHEKDIKFNRFDIAKEAKQQISLANIYSWYYEDVNNIKISIINLDKLNRAGLVKYLTWNSSLYSRDSGGAWTCDSLILLISIMRYQSSNSEIDQHIYNSEVGNVLLIDNLFASTNSKDILQPVLTFAQAAHVQIITFTDHENLNLLDNFDHSEDIVDMSKYVLYFDLVKQPIPNYPGDIQLLVTQANNNITSNYTDTVEE